MTGESTARGATAPPTAVMADGEFPPGREVKDQVTIQMPAEGAYLSVLRTATAGLAARLDFTLDEIEDLRIAVDEACGMLLGQAAPGATLECDFTLGPDRISIAVSAPNWWSCTCRWWSTSPGGSATGGNGWMTSPRSPRSA